MTEGLGGWGWGWGGAILTSGGVAAAFEDTFTDDNSVELGTHTPDTDTSAAGWTENSGDWVISGNAIVTNEDMAVHIATCSVNLSDCTVQCNVNYVTNVANEQIGLIVRGDGDVTNYWCVVLDPSDSLLKIVKCESGQPPSTEASTAITGDFQDNTQYTVKAICSDTRITAYCILGENEDSVYNEEEWMNTETRHGLYGFHRTGYDFMDFDDFTIEE